MSRQPAQLVDITNSPHPAPGPFMFLYATCILLLSLLLFERLVVTSHICRATYSVLKVMIFYRGILILG